MQTELAPSAQRRSRSRHVDSWVYFDGEIVRYHDVHLGPMTHALHYGTGCFEGIRAYWNTAPLGEYLALESGIRCVTSSWRRVPDAAIPARAKVTGSYVNSALAKSEALEAGYDEAIMLSMDGHVSEGSAENLFMFKDSVFVTPPVTDDILEGITRRLMMGLIRTELGVQVVERSIDRTELYACDELFLCGTGAQVSPVTSVDRRRIGDGEVGRHSRRLQEVYFAAVRGEDPRYRDWLTPVYS